MKILLLGKNGQIGWELNRSLLPLGEVIALGRDEADLSRPESLRAVVQENEPDVIINTAAYTAVDKAEQDEELATTINGISVGVLAQEARKQKSLLIHYSTDYVFDGTKQEPYIEGDTPNPINAYGRSKHAGEIAVLQSGCDYLILRTTWVYASRGHNFLRTMLRLAQEHEELRIVADQYGAPTWARNIADVTAQMLTVAQRERQAGGFVSNIYHLSSGGKTTWHGFSMAIIEHARQLAPEGHIKTERMLPILTEDYPLPAPRPKNSILDSGSLKDCYGLTVPDWHETLKLCIYEALEV